MEGRVCFVFGLTVSIMSPCGALRTLLRSVYTRYQNLSLHGKAIICFLLLFYAFLIAFIILVTPSSIAQFIYDLAVLVRRLPYGHFILIAAVVLISFPPFIGYSTLMNLCGFTYGMRGLFPAVISTIAGSVFAFVVLRSLFSSRLQKWSATNEKWRALEAVIHAKGLPLIILIRISPFPPWVYSNSLFASIESVSLIQFVFATLFVLPRAAVYVFIGSRIARFSDGQQRGHMDATTKFLNSFLIIGGIGVAIISSSLVYYFVRKEIEKLHKDYSTLAQQDPNALEGVEEEAPPLVGL